MHLRDALLFRISVAHHAPWTSRYITLGSYASSTMRELPPVSTHLMCFPLLCACVRTSPRQVPLPMNVENYMRGRLAPAPLVGHPGNPYGLPATPTAPRPSPPPLSAYPQVTTAQCVLTLTGPPAFIVAASAATATAMPQLPLSAAPGQAPGQVPQQATAARFGRRRWG